MKSVTILKYAFENFEKCVENEKENLLEFPENSFFFYNGTQAVVCGKQALEERLKRHKELVNIDIENAAFHKQEWKKCREKLKLLEWWENRKKELDGKIDAKDIKMLTKLLHIFSES